MKVRECYKSTEQVGNKGEKSLSEVWSKIKIPSAHGRCFHSCFRQSMWRLTNSWIFRRALETDTSHGFAFVSFVPHKAFLSIVYTLEGNSFPLLDVLPFTSSGIPLDFSRNFIGASKATFTFSAMKFLQRRIFSRHQPKRNWRGMRATSMNLWCFGW